MGVVNTRPTISSCWILAAKSLFCFFFLTVSLSLFGIVSSEKQEIFGTQCSFGITSRNLDGCDPNLLDHRQEFYDNYMDGCFKFYSRKRCWKEEDERLENNYRQPQSMINMTSTGFKKIRAPEKVIKLLTEFWETNKAHKELEDWSDGSVFVNHWEAPSYMVNLEDEGLVGGGEEIKDAIWGAAIDGIAEWTGGLAKLRPVSLYGIREYTEGAVLSPHVDRVPLVSSGIVNVAQDVDEPWPLEVYDRNGHAVNITMEPGDMVFYESHSLIHGRPYALKGRYFANVFIHFEPYDGWDAARGETQLGDNTGDLPPYILPGSLLEEDYREEFPNGWFKDFASGEEPPVGIWARRGKLKKLKEVAELDKRLLWFADENDWQPLHEAVRAGNLEVVKYLVEQGADVNALTGGGVSPLAIARDEYGYDHEMAVYLEELGAQDIGGNEHDREAEHHHDEEEEVEEDDDEFVDDEGDDYIPNQEPSIVHPSIIEQIEKEVGHLTDELIAEMAGDDEDEEL